MKPLDPRPIATADIERLRELTAAVEGSFSELCAANLYLFRDVHAYRLGGGDEPFIQGRTYDGLEHAIPLRPSDDDALRALSERTGLALYPMSPREGWPSTCNRDDDDYVFSALDLISYAGASRKGPRHLRARFRRDYAPRDEPFTACQAKSAASILDAWLTDVARPWGDTDYAACREALTLFEPLGLMGIVTYTAAGDPAGFLLASELGDRSAAIHFAKAKRKYAGVFPHMFSRFAEATRHRFERLNFEQDLGKPGFRQAKRSHGPSCLLRKHRLRPPSLSQDQPSRTA